MKSGVGDELLVSVLQTKTSPNYPHKNNADKFNKNCIHSSGLPKIICTALQKKKKTDERAGEGVTFDRALEIIRIILELRSQIQSLVPMRILCG